MIAVGNSSSTVVAEITEREARLRDILNQLIERGPGSLRERLGELRRFAVSRLMRLGELLANPMAIHEARTLLAEQSESSHLNASRKMARSALKPTET
jgi:hypothetical protein